MNNKTVTKLEIEELKKVGQYTEENLQKLSEGYPIQYLIGYVNFYGNNIKVNENVLIPRYETEYLVEKTIKYLQRLNINNPKILDMCTGSGSIGLTLKKEIPTSTVTLSDISKEAIKVAISNKDNLNLDVTIIESDIFNNITDVDYDCIISNPPYVMIDEVLPKELDYEPKLALFSSKHGTAHLEEIIKESTKYLKDKYLIALEINEKSKEDLTLIVNKYIKDAKYSFENDLQGKTRYLFIYSE